MRRDEEDEDEDEEEDEDDRLAYLVGLARACARGRVWIRVGVETTRAGLSRRGTRRCARDSVSRARGRRGEDGGGDGGRVAIVIVDVGARGRAWTISRRMSRAMTTSRGLSSSSATTPPSGSAVFVVRPERADESIAIDAETLREAVHGYLPNGSTFDDMHAIVRYPFLGALESSREAALDAAARRAEFLDRVSRDARGSDAYATARDPVSRTLGEGARCEEMARVDPEKACRDEDFVGQLEAALSEWCAVLSAARKRNSDDGDGVNDSNADGPLREIHAWRARQSDLRGLVTQLDDSGMRARVGHVGAFRRQRRRSRRAERAVTARSELVDVV